MLSLPLVTCRGTSSTLNHLTFLAVSSIFIKERADGLLLKVFKRGIQLLNQENEQPDRYQIYKTLFKVIHNMHFLQN